MTENERSFRRVMNKIGIAMLLFLAIIRRPLVLRSSRFTGRNIYGSPISLYLYASAFATVSS